MKVVDVLDDRIIDLHMQAKNKDEVLTALSQALKEAGYIEDVERFKEDIYYRESLGETGIGNYIAIPHGQSDSVTQIGIAIGRLEHAIEWETLDGKGVKLVFLFAVSNNTDYARNHMLLLADIARKLGNDEAVTQLLEAKTIDEIKAVFSQTNA